MGRTTRALISRSALAHNLARVREAAPGARVMAVVKADGYGHGLGEVAAVLAGADAFAVSCLAEALALRAAGVRAPVVALQGFGNSAEIAALAEARVEAVVHAAWQLEALAQADPGRPLRVWLKIDTGMGRLGFPPADAPAAWRALRACPAVTGEIRLMTHMANADDPDDGATAAQLARFRAATEGLAGERSLANSGALLAFPESQAEWVRPGIMLYGISPFGTRSAGSLGLRPAMRLETRLIAVNRRGAGDRVGYGGEWVCPEPMAVGVAAVGYGDGYPRHAPAGTPVRVAGREVPLIGRVSMDLITLDLRAAPQAAPGDPVLLWGEDLAVERIAAAAGTIAYELVCAVAGRVERLTVD